jgi:glycosyltransferase involved in cell wall biosynthesis
MVLHVTSAEEANESLERVRGFKAVIIPNAVEIPESPRHYPGTGTLRLLFLGRLHPKKGIENLLEACRKLALSQAVQSSGSGEASWRDWSLVVAGTGDPVYTKTLEERIKKLGLDQRVTMVGEIVGKAKGELFGNADMLVAPSYSENFGMVIAEALAHGVPVVAGKGMPWQDVAKIGCGMWVDNDPDTLSTSIQRMSQLPLEAMGFKGRRWMERDYSWEFTARRMIELYKESIDSRGIKAKSQRPFWKRNPASNRPGDSEKSPSCFKPSRFETATGSESSQ